MPHLTTQSQLMVAGRLGLAAGCLVAPDLVIRLLGFPERSSTVRTFARMLGTELDGSDGHPIAELVRAMDPGFQGVHSRQP